MADDLLTNGGAVLYAKFPLKVLRGSWIKNRKDFPFVVIPERQIYKPTYSYTYT